MLSGGFYFTADDAETLPTRQKHVCIGAIPSGNSVAMLNVLDLPDSLRNRNLKNERSNFFRPLPQARCHAPSMHTHLMQALNFCGFGPDGKSLLSVVLTLKDTRAMLQALHAAYTPGSVVTMRPTEEESPAILPDLRLMSGLASVSLARQRHTSAAITYAICQQRK